MKNIFNKTNAPYLAVGVLATLTLLASGVFALAPYAGFLAPVAALSVGLPFIVGGAVFSAVVVALAAVAISKNNTISQQEKFESRVAQRKQEEENGRAELKAEGLLPDVIALPEISRQENFSNRMAQRKEEEAKARDPVPDVIALPDKDTKVSNLEEQLAEDEMYEDAVEEQDTETPSSANEPAKEETKVNGYLNQAVSTVNWFAHQAAKAASYLAITYLTYSFYNLITTPVSASFDDVNVTSQLIANQGITSSML